MRQTRNQIANCPYCPEQTIAALRVYPQPLVDCLSSCGYRSLWFHFATVIWNWQTVILIANGSRHRAQVTVTKSSRMTYTNRVGLRWSRQRPQHAVSSKTHQCRLQWQVALIFSSGRIEFNFTSNLCLLLGLWSIARPGYPCLYLRTLGTHQEQSKLCPSEHGKRPQYDLLP